jgi:thiol:disulfide interchange protein DsbD
MKIGRRFDIAWCRPNAIVKMMESFLNNPEQYLQGSAVLAVFAVYLGGVLVSFTPCVYPVAPIIIAYIGGRGENSKVRSLLLSIIYVLGMAFTYTLLGAVSALTGKLFGQIQSSPWTYFIVANICIILGLNMLDAITINIPVPGFLGGASSDAGGSGRRGVFGSFIVGATSGLIMGPCTTPVLGVLLAFVAAEQNVLYGMILLFFFSLGMGTLLIILGSFSGVLGSLPRAGAWMVYVKKAFGILMLGLGEYFLITAGQFWV